MKSSRIPERTYCTSSKSDVLGMVGIVALSACFAILPLVLQSAGGEPPLTGPETEKRFPPLKVPPGFQATLFACDPLIEYPSAVTLGPRPGSIFLAQDYLTGLGYEIVRRDEIHQVEDTDGDGYADKATLYADRFNSIQGLAYHAGTVYVMHSPLLTSLQDTDGDGVADQRRDLLAGLGLPPEENPQRLHCANGVVMGHDGWLYLALGDHGCDVPRPEGDRLVLRGGGILRCRPNGRDLHVFATGLRNIYDVALDEELNVFVRDNENDGGDYKIRVYHSFFSADHGYPYLYYEKPELACPPLADLGLGSSAGGLCYLEPAFPLEYRGSLFFCEWGRAVVRYHRERAGSTFAPMKEMEFAAGAKTDPYGFKPTDLIVQRDGSLIVTDWADGQRPRRGRGRVYRISYVGEQTSGISSLPQPLSPPGRGARGQGAAGIEDWIAQLDSQSYFARTEAQAAIEHCQRDGLTALTRAIRQGQVGVRGRLHAVWVLARVGGSESISELFHLAETDHDPRVRALAIRALADLTDPVLTQHRLDAGRGDPETAARLAALAEGQDARVVLEVLIALGRLRWEEAPQWIRQNLKKHDPAVAHAAMQTLRRSENWPALLELLDEPDSVPARALALRAITDRAEPAVVDGLIDRLRVEPKPCRRREFADLLTRVHKKPGRWIYWGYRPPPRPANTTVWERTQRIEQALDHVLADPDRGVRTATLRRMQRERIPTRLSTLARWLREEREPDSVAAILDSLRGHLGANTRELLPAVIGERTHTARNRLMALELFTQGLDASAENQLLELASSVEDSPLLAVVLRHLGRRPNLPSTQLLLRKSSSPDPEVRAAAIQSLAGLRASNAAEPVRRLLKDRDLRARRAAAFAAGKLGVREAIEPLLTLASDSDPALRRASLDSLRRLGEPRTVPLALAALQHPETQRTALECLADLGDPTHADALIQLTGKTRSIQSLDTVVRVLTKWQKGQQVASPSRRALDRAVAEVQGTSGLLLRWSTTGPLPTESAGRIIERIARPQAPAANIPGSNQAVRWQTVFAVGTDSRVNLSSAKEATSPAEPMGMWFGFTDVAVPEQTKVQFLGSSSGTLRLWLNGRSVYQRDELGAFQRDSDRFDATLEQGLNRLVVRVSTPREAQLHVRFRRKSSTAKLERLAQVALQGGGNGKRGREVFFNAEKSQCVKCHRMGKEGGPIGPELTGVGSRFSRIHLIESILEPSRTIAASFQTVAVALEDGQVLSGVKVAETDTTLTLGDNQGQNHKLRKSDIEELQLQSQSTMPDGVEKLLTEREFVDLIAFLVAQKETQTSAAQ